MKASILILTPIYGIVKIYQFLPIGHNILISIVKEFYIYIIRRIDM